MWEKSAFAATCAARVEANRYDVDAWSILLAEAATHNPADFRPLFEAAVAAMPSQQWLWMLWIRAELRAKHADWQEQTEALFELSLMRCPHLELWSLYLEYMRVEKQANTEQLAATLEIVVGAVGADPRAGPLWLEFAKTTAGTAEEAAVAATAKSAAGRRAFHRALCAPCAGLEQLAPEYEAWEVAVSGANAPMNMAGIGERAAAARRYGDQRLALYKPLQAAGGSARALPSGLPTAPLIAGWRALWSFEAANPQELEPPPYLARMRFVLAQAAAVLWRAPQLWHEAASWFAARGEVDAAREVWRRGIEVMPEQPLLYLGLSRVEERLGRVAEACELLERMLEAAPSPAGFVSRIDFAWRAQGVAEARRVFAAARRHPCCTWIIFAASARREALRGGDEGVAVAIRIFELALSKLPLCAALVIEYVNFLRIRGELVTLRAALERGLAAVTADEATVLWDAYVEVEAELGTATSLHEVRERRSKALGDDVDSITALADSSSFLGASPLTHKQWLELTCGEGDEAAPAADNAKPAAAAAAATPSESFAPDVSQMVEYTGAPLDSEPVDGSDARVPIPPALAALLSALPRPGTYAVKPLEPRMLEALCDRLLTLPSSQPAGAPHQLAAAPRGGGVPARRRPPRDVYATRVARRL